MTHRSIDRILAYITSTPFANNQLAITFIFERISIHIHTIFFDMVYITITFLAVLVERDEIRITMFI